MSFSKSLATITVFLFTATSGWAAQATSRDSAALEQEFASTFYSEYDSGACGNNIAQLLRRAKAQGISLTNARVLVFTNQGYLFSVTHRRESGEKLARPVNGLRFAPGAQNFYFHVALEFEGRVYDFDFGNSPEAPLLRDYIKQMFWSEPTGPSPGLEALRERKNYEIAFVPAETFLRTMSTRGLNKLDLSDVYDGLPR